MGFYLLIMVFCPILLHFDYIIYYYLEKCKGFCKFFSTFFTFYFLFYEKLFQKKEFCVKIVLHSGANAHRKELLCKCLS